jgi:hypothetical protein
MQTRTWSTGNMLQAERISTAAYSSAWASMGARPRRVLLHVLLAHRRLATVRAGHFLPIHLHTFLVVSLHKILEAINGHSSLEHPGTNSTPTRLLVFFISRGERLFGLIYIYGDIELYTSYDRKKFADSEHVYNVFGTYPIKPKPTHVKRCI